MRTNKFAIELKERLAIERTEREETFVKIQYICQKHMKTPVIN